MPYTPTTWQDSPSTATPITASELNRIEQGVVDANSIVDLVGINDRAESTISFVDGTRTFTIAAVGASFGVWLGGPMTNKASASVVIADTVGVHFIYFDSADGALKESSSPWDISGTSAPVATVYWDGAAGWLGDERHCPRNQAARVMHEMLHETVGARYALGLAGTFGNSSLSVASGEIYDEDIEHSITTQTTCRVIYRNASNQMQDNPGATVPYMVSAGALQWDSAGTPTAVDANKYAANWVYATNDQTYPIYVVGSQAQYTTAALARAAAQPTIPNISTREWKLLYLVVYRNVGGTPTYIEAVDYRTSSSLPGGAVTALPASSVTFTPGGNIAATNVQTAIEEMDTEKEPAQTAASQVEAEAGTEAAIRSWSPVRVWQAIAKWGITATSLFSGVLKDYKETLYDTTLTGDTTISLANGNVQHLYINPSGASVQLTMPADPGIYGQSFVLFIKNNTGKAHTWNTSPVIKWITETDSDTVPTPAAVGYVTEYAFTWDDNSAGTGRWFGHMCGKETA